MTFLLMIKVWLMLGLFGYILTMHNYKKERRMIESTSPLSQFIAFICIVAAGLFSLFGGISGFFVKKDNNERF